MTTSKEYRGRQEILTQILRTVSNSGSQGIPRTLIIYRVFLSHFQLKEYLSFLVENDLIEKFPQQKNVSSGGNERFLYRITEKGLRFLQISKEIESLIDIK